VTIGKPRSMLGWRRSLRGIQCRHGATPETSPLESAKLANTRRLVGKIGPCTARFSAWSDTFQAIHSHVSSFLKPFTLCPMGWCDRLRPNDKRSRNRCRESKNDTPLRQQERSGGPLPRRRANFLAAFESTMYPRHEMNSIAKAPRTYLHAGAR
jgi:hypothetical protein